MKNTGGFSHPQFQIDELDFLGLQNELQSDKVEPQLLDLEGDSNPELVVAWSEGSLKRLMYIPHTGNFLEPYRLEDRVDIIIPQIDWYDKVYLHAKGQALFVAKQGGALQRYNNLGGIQDANWELVSDAFLGLDRDYLRRNLTVALDDFDNDGKMDMATYADNGVLTIYQDCFGNPVSLESLITLRDDKINHSFGQQVSITSSRLHGTLEPGLVIGGMGGGLQILRNELGTVIEPEIELSLQVYPNPNIDGRFRLISNKSVTVTIISSSGAAMNDPVSINGGEIVDVNIADLPSGLYFIKAQDASGQLTSVRVALAN